MKKSKTINKKKLAIWGVTAAAVGGVTAAIAIPVAKGVKHKGDANPLRGVDLDKLKIGSSTGTQFVDSIKEEDKKTNSELINKVSYKIAFKLYEEEEAASKANQASYFTWSHYLSAKQAIKLIAEISDSVFPSGTRPAGTFTKDSITDVKLIKKYIGLGGAPSDFTTLYDKVKADINKIDITTGSDEKKKANTKLRDDSLTKLDDIKKDYNKTQDKMDAIKNNNVDYDSSTYSSDYPKLLQPIDNIRKKQKDSFEDAREAFKDGYKGGGDGANEWAKHLVEKYNGATSEDEALDYLVHARVQSDANARFSYKRDSSFSVEQYASGIFSDILGAPEFDTTEANLPKTNNTINDAKNAKTFVNAKYASDSAAYLKPNSHMPLETTLSEKVIFLGTNSRIKEFSNMTTKFDDSSIGHIAEVRNAIIGVRPGDDSPDANWVFGTSDKSDTMAILRRALAIVNKPAGSAAGTPAQLAGWEHFSDIFKAAIKGSPTTEETTLSDYLVAHVSGTTDPSQWKGGSYGWKDTNQNIKGMAAGFGIGLVGIFKDLGADSTIPSIATLSTVADGDTFIDGLMGAMKDGVLNAFVDKGILTKPAATAFFTVGSHTTPQAVSTYNTRLQSYLNRVGKDELVKYVGISIRSYVHTIFTATATLGSGTIAEDGQIPPIIDLGDGRYIAFTKDFGMHLISVTENTSIRAQMIKDYQEMVDEQDIQNKKTTSTDYASILTQSVSQFKRMQVVLGLTGVDADGNNVVDDSEIKGIDKTQKYLKEVLDNASYYGYTGGAEGDQDKLLEDLVRTIFSKLTTDAIQKVNGIIPASYSKWLIEHYDKGILVEGIIDPQDIYEWTLTKEVA